MDAIEQAELAVIAEIFRRFPDSLVWVGGSLMRLVHHSPRFSYDIDLVPGLNPPSRVELADAITFALETIKPMLSRSFSVAGPPESEGDFLRIQVVDDNTKSPAFSIDITRIGGTVRRTQEILAASLTGTVAVRIPTDSALLHQKLRALLLRRFPKPGDLFDIWFLLKQGILLDELDRLALKDEFDEGLERLDAFQGQAWIRALSRSGVMGLNEENAPAVVATVREYLAGVLQ